MAATPEQAWAHTGDWSMKWAALPNVEFPDDKTRVIVSSDASENILETLLDRDDTAMKYSWAFTEHPAYWNCGSNLQGSLAVLTSPDDKTLVEYTFQSECVDEEEAAKAGDLMQQQVDSAGAKLVAYIESNKDYCD